MAVASSILPPDSVNFPEEEEKILQLWKDINAFKNTLKQSKGRPSYTFYDGPPFATGLPHYGHILAGTIKDIVTRYAHQTGHHVERRFGWDCHGLPVEYEIDKSLGITSPDDVKKMGIDKYNAECRKIVMRYAEQWKFIVSRLGRWIDFNNDYKTLYPWFMESVWWVFKQIYEKGLVYRGFKVMPYSTACNTPLSNFESSQNYKDVVDPAVVVSFPLDESTETCLIAWTTTPWTLPSNLALCVNPTLEYVKVKDQSTGRLYIMMEKRLSALFKMEEEYEVLEKFKGESLVGKSYEPLFHYFAEAKTHGAFRVFSDNYVTDETGTGVVHQAPAFGEDDYRVCMTNNVIKKGERLVCPVDDSGRFTAEVTDFAGQHVKDADKNIIKMLKANGRLVHSGTFKHSYPFCWRSETPLIYRAVPSWFIKVEEIIDKLLENNKKSYWVPEFVKEKRFHNWLEGARDWSVSRNRYWGTPIPIWASDDMEEVVCVGSVDELERLSGVRVTDLHRENVDNITIPSVTGQGVLRRVPEVFDCWFESGSMPYAQIHYPFERKREFEAAFPADFIAEGVDQTRGWFYTLLVISTALFDKPPFKNLIVNGLVLASDGRKMSKRLKNYPDPIDVVSRFGADALRLYLINSPVVRAETLRFQESGVKNIVKDVFLPWYNACRFLLQNIHRLQREDGINFQYNEKAVGLSHNFMDKWILSFTQSLVKFVHDEMKAYRLYTVVPRLVKFIDMLTNWYVRSNRKRLKGEGGQQDCLNSLSTLFDVLYTMIRFMAPYTPFLTELLYQKMKLYISRTSSSQETDSVHYLMIPTARVELINEDIERVFQRMQTVIELGRVVRDRKTLPTKYPLREVVVIHADPQYQHDIQLMQDYIKEQLNVRVVTITKGREHYGVSLHAEPNYQELGRRLKSEFKQVATAVRELNDEQLKEYQKVGEIKVEGYMLSANDLKISYSFSGEGSSKYEADSDNDVLVLLNITSDQSMLDEGVAREVVNKIQKLRKKAKLQSSDAVTVSCSVSAVPDMPASGQARLVEVMTTYADYIQTAVKQPVKFGTSDGDRGLSFIIEEDAQVKGISQAILHLEIHRRAFETSPELPFCSYCNVECRVSERIPLGDVHERTLLGTVLLENPVGQNKLDFQSFLQEVKVLFNLRGKTVNLTSDALPAGVAEGFDIQTLNKQTVIASTSSVAARNEPVYPSPLVPFVNIEGAGVKATFLLRNPCYGLEISTKTLKSLVTKVFGNDTSQLSLSVQGNQGGNLSQEDIKFALLT
ncbi:isoleucine--tRNA ligase, cytoplasmic-like [Corticium candelabrum]|uniref:isoleucine--tRNA ligase, cytoplasmic-like n=1 Tax=Corticium candelabrum TaxID=121492 RepID=UPI002E265C83|nr:isoleucine--tRNA ligase, cytoplasmic-like [Corticium candelabrum]